MPISEDEYSNQYSNDSVPSTTMSKAELRKTHKPIMEKRRRAKINNCLNEIKDLILAALKKDPERHSKLEKADILEMAVKHLKNIQRQQREMAIRTDPTIAIKYKSGFLECASEVGNYIDHLEGVDSGLKQRLSAYLNKCAENIEFKPTFPFSENYAPSSSLLASFANNRFPRDDQNNNARIQGIELIPSCLPSGEFAFLVPKSSFSSILSGHLGGDRPSAFVTVTPTQKPPSEGLLKISKPLSPPTSPSSSTEDQPRGFQPVIKSTDSKISSTTKFPTEIQQIKFPIHTLKKEPISEPLCIITNNAERYRQAQMLEANSNNEENIYKRKYKDGLLVVAEPPKKIVKLEFEVPSSSSQARSESVDKDEKSNDKSNESMWRPW